MNYPGSRRHQSVLRAIDEHYRGDDRILSLIVFGSVGRGNWHDLSDLDLDVIVADHVEIRPREEMRQLGTVLADIGEHVLISVPNGDDAVDAVLSSLMGISIRYHQLEATSPNIIDSMSLLSSVLDVESIQLAGSKNGARQPESQEIVFDRCLRYLVETSHDIRRERLWSALEGLHRARSLMMVLFAQHLGEPRSLRAFQSHADRDLQSRLEATVPEASLPAVSAALLQFVDLIESGASASKDNWMCISDRQLGILRLIRNRVQTDPGTPTGDMG